MTTDRVKLTVEERAERGSAAVRRLRKQGLIPGVLYGSGIEPQAFAIGEHELRRALGGHGGHSVLDVVVGSGKAQPSVLKDFQRDPVRGNVVHVDLQVVRLDVEIQSTVGVVTVGEPPGTKMGGQLSLVLHEIHVQALPTAIPEAIEVDVSAMEIGDVIRVGDLQAPEGVTILEDPEVHVANVAIPQEMPEPELEVAEGEAAEGEDAEGEGAEGEAAEAGGSAEGDAASE